MRSRWVLVCVEVMVLAGSASNITARAPKSVDNPLITFKGVVNLCERRDAASVAACGSYITGFVQGSHAAHTAAVVEAVAEGVARGKVPPTDGAIGAAAAKTFKESSLFCISSSWTAGYVQAHVVQYAREHPDLLSEPSEDQMLKVLARAFPCNDKQ